MISISQPSRTVIIGISTTTTHSNQPVVTARIAVLLCPTSNPDRVEEWSGGHFGGVADFGPIEVNPFLADIAEIDPSDDFEGDLPVNGTVRLTEIGDGASNTLLIAEAAGRPGMAWSSPSIMVSIKSMLGGTAQSQRRERGHVRRLRAFLQSRHAAEIAGETRHARRQ